MNIILNFSKSLQKYANRNIMIPLFILFILVISLMEKGPASSARLKEISGSGMLDMLFVYNPVQVYDMFDHLGVYGRQLYSNLLGIDFIFAIIFMCLQSLLITVLLQKNGLFQKLHSLNLLPYLRSILDMLENCCLLILMVLYPARFPFLAGLAGILTTLKWIIYGGIIVLAFSLGALMSSKNISSQFNKMQPSRKTL